MVQVPTPDGAIGDSGQALIEGMPGSGAPKGGPTRTLSKETTWSR